MLEHQDRSSPRDSEIVQQRSVLEHSGSFTCQRVGSNRVSYTRRGCRGLSVGRRRRPASYRAEGEGFDGALGQACHHRIVGVQRRD